MVVVGGVEHALVGPLGPAQHADDVRAREAPRLEVCGDAHAHGQLDRAEVAPGGLREPRLERRARGAGEGLGDGLDHPPAQG